MVCFLCPKPWWPFLTILKAILHPYLIKMYYTFTRSEHFFFKPYSFTAYCISQKYFKNALLNSDEALSSCVTTALCLIYGLYVSYRLLLEAAIFVHQSVVALMNSQFLQPCPVYERGKWQQRSNYHLLFSQ